MRRIIIGICGGEWGGEPVGKTTAAKALQDCLRFHYCSLLSPVMSAAIKLAEWDGVWNENGRRIIDAVCRRGRAIREDYWFNMAMQSVPKKAERVVFDDVFFRNEHEAILSSGGAIIRICKLPNQVFESDSERIGLKVTDVLNSSDIDSFRKAVVEAASKHM